MAIKRQQGFTLIELIVVMAIMVVLSVISYRALITALDTRQAVDQYSESLREIELGLYLLTRDLKHIQVAPLPQNKRPFTSEFGAGEKSSGELFRLLRAADATQLRGVTVVSYVLTDQMLCQQITDQRTGERLSTPILKGIESLSINFYHHQGIVTSYWREQTPPAVVDIQIKHQRYGDIQIKEAINVL